MDLPQMVEANICWKVQEEKLDKTYPQVVVQICKEYVVSCCFYLCSLHIQLFFMHWLIHCHELAQCLQQNRKIVKDSEALIAGSDTFSICINCKVQWYKEEEKTKMLTDCM